jgi:ketosteroid isomerase-like protein
MGTTMKRILPILIFAFTSSTLAQEPRINVIFSPESEKFSKATTEYQAIWSAEGKKIVEAMESVSGLRFSDKHIAVIVYEGVSWSGFRDRPMKLRASYPLEIKKATLIHELGHRLINSIRIPKTKQLDEHRVLFLILYDIWEKLYGKEFADKAVEVEKQRKGIYDYESAWQWALSLSKEERTAEFKELREFTNKGNSSVATSTGGSNMTADLERLNEKWNRAWLERDAALVEELMADDYLYIAPNGQLLDRKTILNVIKSPSYRLDKSTRTPVVIKAVGADSAVMVFHSRAEGTFDGKMFKDNHKCTMLCVRRGTEWRVLLEQCSPNSQ